MFFPGIFVLILLCHALLALGRKKRLFSPVRSEAFWGGSRILGTGSARVSTQRIGVLFGIR